jgi:hypothetical protein
VALAPHDRDGNVVPNWPPSTYTPVTSLAIYHDRDIKSYDGRLVWAVTWDNVPSNLLPITQDTATTQPVQVIPYVVLSIVDAKSGEALGIMAEPEQP